MRSIGILFLTIVFIVFEIGLTYFIPIGWILIVAIGMMRFFILIGDKSTALALVISIFLYGGVLALMDKQTYMTHHIKVVKNLIYDQEKSIKKYLS